MATKDKPNNKNLRALFSVICLCIVALGLIVYFSTQSSHTTDVNEATTVVEKAKFKKAKFKKADYRNINRSIYYDIKRY